MSSGGINGFAFASLSSAMGTSDSSNSTPAPPSAPPVTERELRRWLGVLSPGLLRLSTSIVHDRHLAEEIVQEAWVRLWKHPPDGGEFAFKSWMRSTVTNLSISATRRKKRPQALIDESMSARDPRALLPHTDLVHREEVNRVEHALDRLDPDKRQMIMLRVNEGLSYEAIAQHLGVPIGTVMSRLNRARLALLGELGETDEQKNAPKDAAPPASFDIKKYRQA
ncbi:MAG: RNA polymerase sigma factor [Planctomycetota bacterium]|nr:MAG: RNA polymerase sigma factor [Planctomycetota bacterium]RLS90898.1 MAG: RNA polymerase sigma factor [Planctomycetota bacterium]